MILDELFPELRFYSDKEKIPNWQKEEQIWSLLDNKNDNNLQHQIINLCNSINFDIPTIQNVDVDITNGPVFIDKTALIHKYVRIEGPCYIGANTEIRHAAYLRRGSWISENAIVGHSSEVKNSIFLPGSKAPHLNYVGDSILGFNVNLGAGTKLSNVRNDKKEIRLKYKNNESINTGMNKIGAIIGDNSEIGCNVVTNPGTIITSGAMISPNSTISGYFS